ncbi:glycosyltransferase [Actinophytocola sp.]|uniref:glycosyltransferase n=1 Tax=Actinophytocola sp. TaxID=1872138 RepID=UPI00389B1D65
MHLLFLSRPDRGHLYPTLRLAEELGGRGHQVTFASGDPYVDEAAGPGVRVLRFGRDERGLLDMAVFRAQGPVDAVVADPRTAKAAPAFGDLPVVVAGTNLARGHEWPGERAFDPYVFTVPGTRGAVHDPWRPGGRRPVLLVDGPPIGPLVRAFGDTEWQVVVGDSTRYAGLPHADVFLTDGRLAAVSAALRAAVPMVLAPGTAEEAGYARDVVALGAGRIAAPAELPAEDLRRVVEQLRVDEPTDATARRLAGLVEAAGAPATAADRIEDLLTAAPVARAA